MAVLVLLQRIVPPVGLPEVTVAMEFVPQPAAPPAVEPAPAAEPAAVEPPPRAATEASPEPPPPIEMAAPETPMPATAEPPSPPPAESPAEPQAAPPPVVPAPRPAQPVKSAHTAATRPPRMAAAPAATSAPSVTQAAAAIAPLLPARLVAGMESDRPPVYPEMARRRGQQGRVLLQVDVSAQGTPVEVTIAQSSGFASLDDAALRAVQQWRFLPATRGGTPVAAVAEVPVRFRLTN